MVDLVGTCPKDFWEEWIAEGDPAGEPESGQEWGWYTAHKRAGTIVPGDRFYVVAHGRLRGYAPVTRVQYNPAYVGALNGPTKASWVICRRGGAVACTIESPIPGFRGLRERWWDYSDEVRFPDWRSP